MGGRGRLARRQLRDLGHRRHLPRLRPLDGRQDRPHRDHHRAVPRSSIMTGCSSLAASSARPITLEQARALGLDRQIVAADPRRDRCSTSAPARCGSASPMPRSRGASRNDPGFQGPNGQFDRPRFERCLRNAGFTEQRFVAEQRRDMLRQQLVGHHQRRADRAEGAGRGGGSLSRTSSARSNMCCSTAPRRARSRPRRRGAGASISRTAQGAVPRARISQGLIVALTPARTRPLDGDFRRRPQARLRGAQGRFVTPERRQ